jgi:hypothetical protein
VKPGTKNESDVGAPLEAPPLSALALDADPALAREPRLLVDPRFLGVLHFELAQKLGAEQAAANLMQLGFLRGLRDARTLVQLGMRAEGRRTVPPLAPLLALRLARADVPGHHAVQGSWPDQPEAEARLSTLGPAPSPGCWASAGYTSGWLSGLHDVDLLALETACAAAGEPRCRFVARTPEAWRLSGDPRAREALRFLPFEDLCAVVDREIEVEAQEAALASGELGGDSPAVHVWGPVMILPFSGADDSLRAVDLIGCDPEARAVSVVILDLGGVLLDEAFGAVALERTLDAIEGWGAEPILADVAPLSESVVAGMEREHVMVRKSLPEAISTAFQIVQAQRNPL